MPAEASALQPDNPPQVASRDARYVALVASAMSIAATVVYFLRGDVLLYGDAVAHIGIARRVIDSITPGFGQLGTVWLPLPHLLMIPFVAPLSWWREGVAASIPSMIAYVFATVGMFCLFRDVATSEHLFPSLSPQLVRGGAWLAALGFAANPNLLYLQSTAMTEPLSLALYVWALVWLARFVTDPTGPRSRGAVLCCGALLFAGELTRYDAWFAVAFFVPIAAVVWFGSWRRDRAHALSMPGFALFLVLVASAPLIWFWWNYTNTRNPLDFANGPYSARGIEQRVKNKVDARAHPAEGNVAEAASLYVHAVQVNFGEKRWGPSLFWIAVFGTLITVLRAWGWAGNHRMLIWLLLWLPLPFYSNSIAYGSIPIFTPFRWPFSYYNVRYGLQMLPCIALFCAVTVTFVAGRAPRARLQVLIFLLAVVFGSAAYLSCFLQRPNRPKDLLPNEPLYGPIVWREAVINAATRVHYESELAQALASLPPQSKILMYTGDHIGALQRAGIPLRRVVNEANYYEWRLALVAPGGSADYVVAAAGDAVTAAIAADPDELTPIATIDVAGQPKTTLYRADHATHASHDMPMR